MYHNIYQVSDEPIVEAEWITSNDFSDDSFDLSFIGIVSNVDNRKEELIRFGRWLEQQRMGTLNWDFFCLSHDARQMRFGSRYFDFQQAAAALCAVTDLQFKCDDKGVSDLLFTLEQTFTNKFDNYVYYDGELLPMDKFLRYAILQKPYYLGGVCKYQ